MSEVSESTLADLLYEINIRGKYLSFPAGWLSAETVKERSPQAKCNISSLSNLDRGPAWKPVATRLRKMQFISVYLYIYLLTVRAHLTFSETYKRGKVNHLFYASYSRPILILLFCGGIYSGKRRVTITNKNNTLSPCPSRSKTSSYVRASTRGVGRSLSSEKDSTKLRRIGIVLSQGWCGA